MDVFNVLVPNMKIKDGSKLVRSCSDNTKKAAGIWLGNYSEQWCNAVSGDPWFRNLSRPPIMPLPEELLNVGYLKYHILTLGKHWTVFWRSEDETRSLPDNLFLYFLAEQAPPPPTPFSWGPGVRPVVAYSCYATDSESGSVWLKMIFSKHFACLRWANEIDQQYCATTVRLPYWCGIVWQCFYHSTRYLRNQIMKVPIHLKKHAHFERKQM